MKRLVISFLTLLLLLTSCNSKKSDFGKFFIDKTLRINLIHTGNDTEESFKAKYIYDDGPWYGRTRYLVNPYHLGDYYYELRDVESDKVIYSDGVSTYFSQWQKTLEAKIVKKSFNESIRIPYPEKDARLIMYRIDSLDVMHQVWEYVIDRRAKVLIEPPIYHNNRIVRLLDSGDPKKKVDIVILGEAMAMMRRRLSMLMRCISTRACSSLSLIKAENRISTYMRYRLLARTDGTRLRPVTAFSATTVMC